MPKTRYCSRARKVAFKDELDAKMTLAYRKHRDKGEVRYYRCNFGPHYHLTSEETHGSKK